MVAQKTVNLLVVGSNPTSGAMSIYVNRGNEMSKNRFGKDRFDLEHAMNDIRTTATDIQTVADMMYESSLIYTEDRIHTVLSGLAEVLEAKCEKAEQVFKMVYELDEYSSQYYKDADGVLRWKDTGQPLESQLWDKV